MKRENNGSLSAIALDLSGWVAAVAFAVYALAAGTPSAADGDCTGEAVAGRAAEAAKPEPDEARAELAATYDPVPGDDWVPPGEVGSFEGIDAICSSLSPADRALVDRMRAAYESRSTADAVALAREARGSRDPKVRLLALKMLEACVEAESASGAGDALGGLMDATMDFWQDSNDSVRKAALASGAQTMSRLPPDTALGMLGRIVEEGGHCGDRWFLYCNASRAMDAVLGRMVAGDAVKWVDEALRIRQAGVGSNGDSQTDGRYFLDGLIVTASGAKVATLLGGGFAFEGGLNMDDGGVAEWKARRGALEALGAEKSSDPLFPPRWAAAYERAVAKVGKLFKDIQSEEAQNWLADEMEVAAADISAALEAEREGGEPESGNRSLPVVGLPVSIQTGEHTFMLMSEDL